MTDKKPTTQRQKTDQQPDFFQLLRQQQGNNPYMRFYLQQDKYTFHPFHIKNQSEMLIQSEKNIQISLPINKLIYNTVTDVLIANKFVYNNSKIMNSILDSGREMILGRYVKKHFTWVNFLNMPELKMIKQAYQSLSYEDQSIIEYTVLAVSNLILKLGINISKLSCILTQRKYTTRFLSIPTLSILYLQCLMHTLVSSKETDWSDEQGKSQFIRQLPRITYIKISQFINKQQLLLMEIGEHTFFSSQSLRKVRNLQYLQFYQQKANSKESCYSKITDYEHIHSINMSKLISEGSPYGYQLLFLFRTMYFSIIKDFNPDVIIFVEDYQICNKIIQPQVRALLLAQLMQNVTGKVFVMRQVGYRWNGETQTNFLQEAHISQQPKSQQFNHPNFQNQQICINQSQTQNKIEQEVERNCSIQATQGMSSHQIQQFIVKLVNQIPKMNKQHQQQLNKKQQQLIGEALHGYDQGAHTGKANDFSTMENILRDDVAYIALALIQRTSFEQTSTKSYQYIYSQYFIESLINHLNTHVGTLQAQTQLHTQLSTSRNQLLSMQQNMKLPTLVCYKNYYDSVYVIPTKMSYELNILKEDNTFEKLTYFDEDYVHVHYGKNGEVLVFVFSHVKVNVGRQTVQNKETTQTRQYISKQNILLVRLCIPNLNEPQQYYFQKIFTDFYIDGQSQTLNPTYLITDDFIYRAFGAQKSTKNSSGKILRAQYRHLLSQSNNHKITESMEIQQSTELSRMLNWQQFTTCKHFQQKTQISLMQKQYGWAMYDQLSKSAIFAGGYVPHGQFNINKYMHVFSQKNHQTYQMGKTSAQIFLGVKYPKAKIPLFPFIYGIPFMMQKTCFILNTNGFFQCFTNCNKLFLTEFKLSQQPTDQKHGILSQRKLFVNYEDEDHRLKVVATKEFIVHFIVNSYKLNNCYQNVCILQTLDEGMMEMRLVKKIVNGKDNFELIIDTDRPQYNGKDFAVLEFKAHDI